MTVETLVHGPKEFSVTLKYSELDAPITESFYTKIEAEAFIKGIKLAAIFIGMPIYLKVAP